jgi:hypothetical protein
VRALFVVGNAGHHAAIAAPVARDLARRGHDVDALSVAELRGLPSPASSFSDARVFALVPAGLRSRMPQLGSTTGQGASASSRRAVRRLARRLVWSVGLRARVAWIFGRARPDVVVVPNDAAFPYDGIVEAARRRGLPVVLLQEGVRFPLPAEERTSTPYGAKADHVCAWGERSAAHFRGVTRTGRVHVTGNPRYDGIDLEQTRKDGRALACRLGLDRRPLVGFLSNPIDDQGFCSTAEKMKLFEDFVAAATPALRGSGGTLVVKLHPREDAAAFRASAARADVPVVVAADAPVLPLLSVLDAGVVLTSTVGLEAMMFDVPVGALEIPRAGHVFDYVESGAALAMHADARAADEVAALLNGFGHSSRTRRASYVEEHLAHRGEAARRCAEVVESAARERT